MSSRQEPPGPERRAARELAATLEPGDIILVCVTQTETPGIAYSALRELAGSYFDHVSVFLNKDQTLHIGRPRVQVLPSYTFLTERRKPFVLRLREDLRGEFLEAVKDLESREFSTTKAWYLWSTFAI